MPKSTRVPQRAQRQVLCTQESGIRGRQVPARTRAWDGAIAPPHRTLLPPSPALFVPSRNELPKRDGVLQGATH